MGWLTNRKFLGVLGGAIVGAFTGASALDAIGISLSGPYSAPVHGLILLGGLLGMVGGAISGWVAAS